MIQYSPLSNISDKTVFGVALQNASKYLFLTGIIFNILISAYLYSRTGIWHHADSANNYETVSKDNFQQLLDVAHLDFTNSSSLFNEVENAVKQKNADLNPIGVTYFPAFISEGTFLYHSNGDGLIPSSFEWVAMDYEFSYNFAHFRRPNRGGRRGPPPGGPHKGPHTKGGPGGKPPPKNERSYLLTFKAVKPLDKLIYLGGASAAKTSTGEMDTQYLLSQMDDYEEFDEREGAERICAWGNSNGRKLDGIVRLEVGFEIIICDFYDKLELVQNVTLSLPTEVIGFPKELPTKEGDYLSTKRSTDDEDENKQRSKIIDIYENMSGYDHLLSGEYVYDGDQRIHLDFSKVITLINRTQMVPDTYTRRISNISQDVNTTFLKDMDVLLSGPTFDPFSSTNWEVVTHRIVKKFSPIFMLLNQSMNGYLDKYDSLEAEVGSTEYLQVLDVLGQNLTAYTFNFVRRYANEHYEINSDEQIKDSMNMMVWDYIHPYQPLRSHSDFLIWASIANVQTKIIDEIYDLFSTGKEILVAKYVNKTEKSKSLDSKVHDSIVEKHAKLNTFIEDLNWSIFYRCSQVCQFNEICLVPTWGPSPLGWGVNEKLNTHHLTDDGVLRINKDLICLGPQTLMDAKGFF